VRLLQARPIPFATDKFFKNRENLLAIVIDAPYVIPKVVLELLVGQPFLEQWFRDIDVAAECFERVASQEKAIEHGRFTLGGQRVEVVSELCIPHKAPLKTAV
jgi:hypothetical protein